MRRLCVFTLGAWGAEIADGESVWLWNEVGIQELVRLAEIW